jgi:predicted RNA binding protein YcfA (HicA-like mRNA interferase family)
MSYQCEILHQINIAKSTTEHEAPLLQNNWDLTPIYTMRQNPNDWAMAKLLTVAKQHGLEVRSTGGSHHVFSHPSAKDPLSVPAHRPIKAIYIKRFVALIDQILE